MHVPELTGPDRLIRIAEALSKRGYKGADVDRIMGTNFLRVLRESIG